MPKYLFKLFVTGHTSRAAHALANLRRVCSQSQVNDFDLDIIDVLEQPQLAEDYLILATPTLIKESPGPQRRIIGDLRTLDAATLGIEPAETPKQYESDRDA